MFRWIKKKIKIWKMSQEFTRQCEQLLNNLNGARVENYLEIELLHPETGNKYWFTIRRAEGLSPAQKNTKLEEDITNLRLCISNIFTEEQLDCYPIHLKGQSVRQWMSKFYK